MRGINRDLSTSGSPSSPSPQGPACLMVGGSRLGCGGFFRRPESERPQVSACLVLRDTCELLLLRSWRAAAYKVLQFLESDKAIFVGVHCLEDAFVSRLELL
jgi:hypothetical protein